MIHVNVGSGLLYHEFWYLLFKNSPDPEYTHNLIYSLIFLEIVELCYSIASNNKGDHCVKSVQIRSFLWSVLSCVWTE